MTLEQEIIALVERTRGASRGLARASTQQKNDALERLASLLRRSGERILAANADDLKRARVEAPSAAFIERLTLNAERIESMAHGVEEVVALADPVGALIEQWTRPNGLEIGKVRVPIGVIAMIYESRPNVTIDAGALITKSGNAVVLRGGREAVSTNGVLAELLQEAMSAAGLDSDAAAFIANTDREVIQILKGNAKLIDLIIPRGGAALKQALAGSAVPLLPHFDGICHSYVDASADPRMAQEICLNAKCNRPSVCNAMENLLVHAAIAERFLPSMLNRFAAAGVEVRGCARTRKIGPSVKAATEADWDTEYLDMILSIRVVDSLDEAIAFIALHGSGLADAIVTNDRAAAERFEREVDSSTVYVNASTRFTDGFEFGFGAETGISTNRLHARGPMGLNELTTYKYVVRGSGQVRS
ncbi:MAG: glutamate-5-semialdehyde dehydrogenase [Candidatus Binataceae bacterium]